MRVSPLLDRGREGDGANRLLLVSAVYAKTLIAERVASSEKHLRKLLEMADDLVAGSRLGTWDWNVQIGDVFDERWAALFGYPRRALPDDE